MGRGGLGLNIKTAITSPGSYRVKIPPMSFVLIVHKDLTLGILSPHSFMTLAPKTALVYLATADLELIT